MTNYNWPPRGVTSINNLVGDVTLAAGSGITITPSGNVLTIAASDAQSPWTTSGNSGTDPASNFIGSIDNVDFVTRTNNTEVTRATAIGLLGVQKSSPNSVLHIGVLNAVVPTVPSLSYSVVIPAAGSGYAFGSGSKDYAVYGSLLIETVRIYSSAPATVTATELATTDFDPASFVAISQNGSGYDPNIDSPPGYQIWAIYGGGTAESIGTVTAATDGGTWADTSSNKDVNITWNAPLSGIAPDYYFISRNGSDNQTSASLNLLDTNSGWAGGATPSFPDITYGVHIVWGSIVGVTDYRALNTTSGTFIDAVSVLAETDDGTWASGSTVSPTTAPYASLKADGDSVLNNVNVSGDYQSTNGDITLTNGSLTLTNGDLTLSGGNLAVTGAASLGTVTLTGDTAAQGNFSVSGVSTLNNVTMIDNRNFILGTTTGTKLGTSPTQKLGFFAATPIVRPSGDIPTALSDLGLVTSGTFSLSSVSGGTANNLTSKKFTGGGSTPSWVVGAGAGTGATVFSAGGSDSAGSISITTGATPTGSNATIATGTFNTAYVNAPYLSLTPANAVTALLAGVSGVFPSSTTTTFVITSGTTALTASTVYKWYYHVIE